MIYITGDTHGSFDDVEEFCQDNYTAKDDILIILGDAGINYYGDPQDRRLKNRLSELPITLFCIHGNHEMRPERISTYDEVERFGGVVYCESEFPNLLFAKDGEIYEFNKRRCIAIGGAYSIDRWSRTPGVDWWDDEQPSDAVKEYVESRLKAVKWKVDVVLSHTCPLKYMPTEAFLPGINKRDADNDTEEWLDTIEKRLNYSEWWCGHFHTEKYIAKMRFLYNNIIEFEEDY
jgi:3-oxoacid CoA-transferase subunit A